MRCTLHSGQLLVDASNSGWISKQLVVVCGRRTASVWEKRRQCVGKTMSIFSWIRDPENRAVASFIGTGVAAIAGGAWALFAYFHPVVPPPPPESIHNASAISAPAHIPRRFVYASGSFDKTGLTWQEHTGFSNVTFNFVQDGVVEGYLHLVDSSRSLDANRPFTVRLPLNGGMAQWSYPNPFVWQNLYLVHPED
jgi:hypothetical protein